MPRDADRIHRCRMNYQCPHCRAIVPLTPEHMPFNCACGTRYETLAEMRETTKAIPRHRFKAKRAKVKSASREERLLRLLPEPDRIRSEAKARGKLLGDVICAMTKAVGFPPCGGCDARREWLNNAHAWVRGWFASP